MGSNVTPINFDATKCNQHMRVKVPDVSACRQLCFYRYYRRKFNFAGEIVAIVVLSKKVVLEDWGKFQLITQNSESL